MAPGGFVATPAGGQRQYNSKLTFTVLVCCIVAACGGLLFGCRGYKFTGASSQYRACRLTVSWPAAADDNGVVGGVTAMLPFQQKFFPAVYEHSVTGSGGSQTSNTAYCELRRKLTCPLVSLLCRVVSSITRARPVKITRSWLD